MTDDSRVFRPGPGPFTANAPALSDGTLIGGGGSGSGVQTGDGVNPPADPSKEALYIPADGSAWLGWPAGGSSWI